MWRSDGLHVVLGVDRAGLVGADGETHHGCFDALYLSQVPHMTVLCPASFAELRTDAAPCGVGADRPCGGALSPRRRGGVSGLTAAMRPLRMAASGERTCTLLTYGILINEALAAAELLARSGVSRPGGEAEHHRAAGRRRGAGGAGPCTKRLLVLEDCVGSGCVGQRLAAIMAQLWHGCRSG